MDQPVGIDQAQTVSRTNYRKGVDARTSILDSAIRLLAERGYGGCPISELSADSGCSKNQLFHHFGSKEDLAIEAVLAAFGLWRADVAGQIQNTGGPDPSPDRLIEQVRVLESEGWPAARLLALLTLTASGLPSRLKLAVEAVMGEINSDIRKLCEGRGNGRDANVLAAATACLVFGWGASTSAEQNRPVVTPGMLAGPGV